MFNPIRLFSFSDWNRNHPADQPPGDRLDEVFAAAGKAIHDVSKDLSQIRRSDGALKNGVVTKDSLDPSLMGVLTDQLRSSIAPDLDTVKSLASTVASARILVAQEAERARLAALASEEKAKFIEDRLPVLLKTVGKSTDNAHILLDRVEARAADIVNDANDAQYWGNYAYSWGQVSYNWAEYMAGPIPPDILATMGISGNHWSSRWWANQATLAVGDAEDWANQAQDSANQAAAALDSFTDLYLGPHPSNPTLDNDGNPLQVGAVYYNTSDSNMYVWTGSIWQVSSSAKGWVPEAPIDNALYSRKNASWVVAAGGVSDAPNDGKAYGRKSQTWTQLNSDDVMVGAGPLMVSGALNLKADQSALTTETNARIAGDQANSAAITGLKASQVSNDSSVTGTTVKDALNTNGTTIATHTSQIAANTAAIAAKQDKSTGLTNFAALTPTLVAGDVLYATGADTLARLPKGNVNESLTVGASGLPLWKLAAAPIAVTDNPPATALDSSLWWESDTGYLYLKYNDGNSSQWVQVNGIPAAVTAGYVAKSGDTMTGPLLLAADPVQPLEAATKQYSDLNVLRTGDTMTGALTIAPPSGPPLFAISKSTAASTITIAGKVGANNRWTVSLGNGVTETGSGNTGSDFGVTRYSDAGVIIDSPIYIARTNAMITFGPLIAQNTAINGQNVFFGNKNSQNRWAIVMGDNIAESGANAGCNWSLLRYADNGSFIQAVMQANRATGVVSFTQTIINGSDARLKENIEPIAGALDKVKLLQGVSFNRIGQANREIGFIAQDVLPVVSEVVQETEAPRDENGVTREGVPEGGPYLGLAYAQLTALLVEAVKELSTQNAALEARISNLEAMP